ncbi:hypothetical protein D3C86_1641890 [compost metagenome]
MDVNDNACFLNQRVGFKSFASKLAPTGLGLIAVLRPSITVTITPPANSQVIGSTCSPKNSAEKAMVKKICSNWI